MGSFDWAREDALELITENGVAATLRKRNPATPGDSSKPWRTANGAASDTAVVICLVASVGNSMEYTEGGQTRKGSMLGLLAAPLTGGIVPDVGNQIVSTKVWTVKAIREHAPDGVAILWELVLDL